jgi:hypothetical protein
VRAVLNRINEFTAFQGLHPKNINVFFFKCTGTKKTLPVGHLSQLELPDAAEYCPAAQVSHDVLPGQIVGDVNQGQSFFFKGRQKQTIAK